MNGTNGKRPENNLKISICSLMSGHIFKPWFASQAKLRKQKNGRQKNGA
jgi:hypothetical protein